MDFSWPRNGKSVNDGISKEKYMGHDMKLHYPTVDDLCRRAAKLGVCMGYKRDMDRAFKQMATCVSSWPLTGIIWQGLFYFDKMAMMGCRSTPYVCQRTTNFIRHIMKNLEYFVANYVDDFMGLEKIERVWSAYNVLGNLLRDVGTTESIKKAVPPSFMVEFLGVLFNLLTMTMHVTDDRLMETKAELARWMDKKYMTRKELESLLGKLQVMSNCI